MGKNDRRHTLPARFREAEPLYDRLCRMGYEERVGALNLDDLTGRHVLDVGCGSGFYGPVFIAMGAASYTGCDYKFDPASRRARDFTTLKMTEMDWSGGDLMRLFPGCVDLRAGGWENLPRDRTYDLILMTMVTEHIMDLDGAFAAASRWLAPDGSLHFLHHNYAAWNGHHLPPRTIHEIVPGDPGQARYMDWNHLIDPPGGDDYTARKLNRIRLDELRAMTQKHFTIRSWEELPVSVDLGRDRLTPETLAALPGYSERELLCQTVRCHAGK